MAIQRRKGCFSIPVKVRRTSDLKTVKTLLHSFSLGDVDDPEIYAALPIHDWQQTEVGKWCMEHMVNEGTFVCQTDPYTFGYRIIILGELSESDHTYFQLKYGRNTG